MRHQTYVGHCQAALFWELTLQTWALELIGIRCIGQPQMGPWSSELVLHRLLLGLQHFVKPIGNRCVVKPDTGLGTHWN